VRTARSWRKEEEEEELEEVLKEELKEEIEEELKEELKEEGGEERQMKRTPSNSESLPTQISPRSQRNPVLLVSVYFLLRTL